MKMIFGRPDELVVERARGAYEHPDFIAFKEANNIGDMDYELYAWLDRVQLIWKKPEHEMMFRLSFTVIDV